MTSELYGLVRLKAINTPNYFNNLRTELFLSFKGEETEILAKEVLERTFNMSNDNSEFNMPKSLVDNTSEVFKKLILTGGINNNNNLFLDCAIKFDGKNSKFNKIKDTIAEMIIRDGIVSKINIIEYPKPNS